MEIVPGASSLCNMMSPPGAGLGCSSSISLTLSLRLDGRVERAGLVDVVLVVEGWSGARVCLVATGRRWYSTSCSRCSGPSAISQYAGSVSISERDCRGGGRDGLNLVTRMERWVVTMVPLLIQLVAVAAKSTISLQVDLDHAGWRAAGGC